MNRLSVVFLLSIGLVLGPAGCGGSDPESQLQTINDLRAMGFPLTAQQTADVERLVAEGDELLRTGSSEQAGETFGQAIEILEFAEDAAMFNKSE